MGEISFIKELQEELESVDQELIQYIEASDQLLNKASTHLIKAGGKRLRPAFALLAGKFGNYSQEKLLPLMVALEMIHMASLVHDDVVDNTLIRRGVPTVKAQWGKDISIHTGDYIFAKSLALISTYANKKVPFVLAKVSTEMSQGEIQQLASAFDVNQSVRDYFYRIRRKTALLIAASCQLGVVVTDGPLPIENALKKYGYYLGMAFQITDDILDFTAKEAEIGKPIANDLKQGIITLPIIYALRKQPFGSQLKELIKGQFLSPNSLEEAILVVKESGALTEASLLAERFIGKAKDSIQDLPSIPAKAALDAIADFVSSRRF